LAHGSIHKTLESESGSEVTTGGAKKIEKKRFDTENTEGRAPFSKNVQGKRRSRRRETREEAPARPKAASGRYTCESRRGDLADMGSSGAGPLRRGRRRVLGRQQGQENVRRGGWNSLG